MAPKDVGVSLNMMPCKVGGSPLWVFSLEVDTGPLNFRIPRYSCAIVKMSGVGNAPVCLLFNPMNPDLSNCR